MLEFVLCVNAIYDFLGGGLRSSPSVVVAFRSLAIHPPFAFSVEFIYYTVLYVFSLDKYVDRSLFFSVEKKSLNFCCLYLAFGVKKIG